MSTDQSNIDQSRTDKSSNTRIRQIGKYKELFEKLETGDILLFHGVNYLFSYIIEWATWSDYSHVGIVLKDPTYIDPSLTGYFMLESGTENFPDAVYHRINLGVQIVDLEIILDQYQGRVYHRRLQVPEEIKPNLPPSLTEIWEKVKNLPYDDSAWDLLRTELGIKYGDMKRTNTFFCSALSTFIYDRCKLLNETIDWDLVRPKDWDQNGKIDQILKCNVTLGPRICLKK
jgi:hypothetical protein